MASMFDDVLSDSATPALPSVLCDFNRDELWRILPQTSIASDSEYLVSDTGSLKADTVACAAQASIALSTQALVETLARVVKDVVVQHHEVLQSELSQLFGCHVEVCHKSDNTADASSSSDHTETSSNGGSLPIVNPGVVRSSSVATTNHELSSTEPSEAGVSRQRHWSFTQMPAKGVPKHFEGMHSLTVSQFAGGFRLKMKKHVVGFEVIAGTIIISNAFFLGLRAHLMVGDQTAAPPQGIALAASIFTGLFAMELVLRLVADSRSFFSASDRLLNLFDVALVLLSILDELLTHVWHVESGGISIGMFQIIRAMRIVRVVRVMRHSPTLNQFLIGLATVLKPFSCAMILFQFVIFVFSVIFTEAATSHKYGACFALCPDISDEAKLGQHFGTLRRSWGTLFQAVSGGVDWGDVANPLLKLGHAGRLYYTLFALYIFLIVFALLNVITALFCQHVVDHYLQSNMLESKHKAMQQAQNELLKLFGELDELNQSSESPEGVFTYPDLVRFLADDRVKGQLLVLGIDPGDAWELFKLLDEDQTGLVGIHQFVRGCMRLRGEARRLDLHLMLHEFYFSSDKQSKFMQYAAERLDVIEEIGAVVTQTSSTIG